MKKNIMTGLLMMLFLLATLAACGGGGGGGAAVLPSTSNTKAILTLSTSGTGTISGIEATLNLPAGVTAKASLYSQGSTTYVTDPGVVTAMGAAANPDIEGGSYMPGDTPSTHKIRVVVTKLAGFGTGDFATVNCDIVSGSPSATSFTLTDFKATDELGATILGITPGFTAVFQ